MLDIIVLWVLTRSIGHKVAAKGHRRFGYQLMLVALWIGGEFVGATLGVIVQLVTGNGPGSFWKGYICALAGAVIGALIAFAVANSLAPVQNDADFYEIDEHGRDDQIRRGWREAKDRPLGNGDQIQERPAARREEDRIQE